MSGTGATPSAGAIGAWERLNPDGQRAPHRQSEADGEASGWTILLADDEPAIRDLAGQVLRSHGYTVLEAADGLEALEVAERHPGPIHLLLTDWCMPRLDGEGLIRRLSGGRPETAILVMSGYVDDELPPKSALLRKPFNSQALVESVSGALQGQ
jgi:two-component system, cell cycle sensor histidine kinase and response regulator CckA